MARPRKFSVELLEDRTTPTTFSIPWPDAGHLTLSFAPDSTAIAGQSSNLFAALDAQLATPDWQREVLRAFQTWAMHANINLSVQSDDGQPFGSGGRLQGDLRFGDIRVGAQPMSSEVLAVSVPPDLFRAGTWAGDLLLNSSAPFTADTLFRVVLHEVGNILGLPDQPDPTSVLFPRFTAQVDLSAGDIAALQALYGARTPDAFEGSSGNDTIPTAVPIRSPAGRARGHDGATPLVIFADLTTPTDVDVFSFRPNANYSGPVTFLLQSAGISLLAPRLTVLDEAGNVLGEASSTDPFGAVVSVRLDSVRPHNTYYIRIESAAGDGFSVGSYGLAVTHDANLTVPPGLLHWVLRGPFESLSAEDIDRLFRDPTHTFVNDDQHSNDTFPRATMLRTRSFDSSNTHAEVLASLGDAVDVDFYRLQAGITRPGQVNVLTATILGIGSSGTVARVSLFDWHRRPVPAQVLINGNGIFTIQALLSPTGGPYYVSVSAPPGTEGWVGNYSLQLHLGQQAASPELLTSGILDDTAPEQGGILYVARSQLFQLTLSAEALGAAADAAVSLTLFDSLGQEIFRLTALTGQTVTGPNLFLAPGTYTASISLQTPSASPPLLYRLWGSRLTDPIGPALEDPTLLPLSTTASEPILYHYPGDVSSFADSFWVSVILLLLS